MHARIATAAVICLHRKRKGNKTMARSNKDTQEQEPVSAIETETKMVTLENSGEFTGKSYVDENGRKLFPFIVTSRSLDRVNEIVDSTTLKVDSFRKNPRMYYQHNRYRSTIGEWVNLRMEGSVWIADAYFHCLPDIESGEPISERVMQYVETAQLKTCSIGFNNSTVTVLPITDGVVRTPDGLIVPVPNNRTERINNSWERGVKYHQNAELLEISIVDIPANEDAMAKIKAFNLELETKIGKPISGNNFKKIKMAKVHSDECSKALKELADSIGEILDDDEDNNTSDQEGKPKEEAEPKEPVKSIEDLEAHFTALHDELKAEMKTMYEHTQSALAEIATIKKSLEPLTSDFVLRNLKLKHNL